MIKFTITNEINCNADTFWKVFFDKVFTEKIYRETLGFADFKVISQQDTATQTLRKITVKPKMNIPDQVAALLGNTFSYTDDGVFDKATKVFKWKGIPSQMADVIKTNGALRIEVISATKVRRIVDMTVEVNIFGVGELMEGLAKTHIYEGWDHTATAMNSYLASKPS